MADTYAGSVISSLQESTPQDSESIGNVGKAIRQIKRVLLNSAVSPSTTNTGILGIIDGKIQAAFEAYKAKFPIGYIYIAVPTSGQTSSNPQELFGGYWQRLEQCYLANAENIPTDGESTGTAVLQYQDRNVNDAVHLYGCSTRTSTISPLNSGITSYTCLNSGYFLFTASSAVAIDITFGGGGLPNLLSVKLVQNQSFGIPVIRGTIIQRADQQAMTALTNSVFYQSSDSEINNHSKWFFDSDSAPISWQDTNPWNFKTLACEMWVKIGN